MGLVDLWRKIITTKVRQNVSSQNTTNLKQIRKLAQKNEREFAKPQLDTAKENLSFKDWFSRAREQGKVDTSFAKKLLIFSWPFYMLIAFNLGQLIAERVYLDKIFPHSENQNNQITQAETKQNK
eukprot:c13853_g1_i1.p1 GENE.c13853_g1_i1~~c13853_g1_i1.p1  ORF type:complete len:125 (+),score=30.70 c13853_g1_i1:22-396(+)